WSVNGGQTGALPLGAASTRAPVIACAPRHPAKTKTRVTDACSVNADSWGDPAPPNNPRPARQAPANDHGPHTHDGPVSDRPAARTTPGGRGLLLPSALAQKKPAVAATAPAAAATTRPASRLVNPGTAFCSSSIVGMPRSEATRTTGPELNPPTPITKFGRRR